MAEHAQTATRILWGLRGSPCPASVRGAPLPPRVSAVAVLLILKLFTYTFCIRTTILKFRTGLYDYYYDIVFWAHNRYVLWHQNTMSYVLGPYEPGIHTYAL